VGTRTLPLWREVPPPLREHVGREVVLGLRAEDVHRAEGPFTPESVTLDAVVSDVQYTGRHNVVGLAVGAPPVAAPGGAFVATLHAFFPPRMAIRPRDAVRVSVEAARAHVFDAGTGRALCHPGNRRAS
jgi:multiple sugar transport system ATP-binding protein